VGLIDLSLLDRLYLEVLDRQDREKLQISILGLTSAQTSIPVLSGGFIDGGVAHGRARGQK
jgi:hypothetical protein